jgi:hypothetical protein
MFLECYVMKMGMPILQPGKALERLPEAVSFR